MKKKEMKTLTGDPQLVDMAKYKAFIKKEDELRKKKTKKIQKGDPRPGEGAWHLAGMPERMAKYELSAELDEKALQKWWDMEDWSEFCDTATEQLSRHIPTTTEAENRRGLDIQFVALMHVCEAKALEKENPKLATMYYKTAIAYLIELDLWIQETS